MLIVCALCASIAMSAQEIAQDSLATDSIGSDSISVESLELVPMQVADSSSVEEDTIVPVQPYYMRWNDSVLSDIELRAMDWSLRWLDTTDCIAMHDTTTLPDSVYKARLHALQRAHQSLYPSVCQTQPEASSSNDAHERVLFPDF